MLPCGTYSCNYSKDMAVLRTRSHWGLLIAFLVLLATIPLFAGYQLENFITLVCFFVINAVGLNILLGYTGQVALGQAAFMAVGAYTSGILTARAGIPFIVTLPLAGLVAGAAGIIFGLPSVRVKGFYLALVTLGAQFIIIYIVEHLKITGGTDGMTCPFASIGGLVLDTPSKIYWLVMAVTVILVLFAMNLMRTRVGRAFIAVRDNDIAAEVLGVNIARYKLLAFFIGCFYSGIAGALWAHYTTSLHPSQFPLHNGIFYLGIIVVGGMGTMFGPIAGAIVMRGLDEVVMIVFPKLAEAFPSLGANMAPALGPMAFGLVFILFLMFEPRGIAHGWRRLKSSVEHWPFTY